MTVLITGGARGIGRMTAELLLEAGRSVIVLDRDISALAELRERDGLTAVEGDATNVDLLQSVCLDAGLTGVVASAGISRPGPSLNYPVQDWNEIIAVNLTAVFDTMRVAAESAQPGASFVAISSVTAHQGFAGRAAYAASKAGVEAVVRTLAVELAPRIRVNAVAPGFIMTDIARENISRGVIDSAQIRARTPLGRWGQPIDVARSIRFLLDDESSWVTGSTITVDGGWLSYGALGTPGEPSLSL
jgi:NAD(P)-dependent dehydrogenase (short-subunit alcohol dehydrogenase family)